MKFNFYASHRNAQSARQGYHSPGRSSPRTHKEDNVSGYQIREDRLLYLRVTSLLEKYKEDPDKIAEYLGISEATMCRKMRSELDPEFRETVLDAIQALGNPPGYGKIQSAGSSAVVDK